MRCVGTGVPGDWFEFGHEVVPGTEATVFVKLRPRASKKGSFYATRCRRCASTRYHWQREEEGTTKAADTFRRHRAAMVRKGFARTLTEAETLMNGRGVTRSYIRVVLQGARGKPCPGLCAERANGTWQTCIITRSGDVEFDWRDPSHPLSQENCGPLCGSCNRQKGNKSWAEFMATQHAIRMNLERGRPLPPPPTQLGFNFDGL